MPNKKKVVKKKPAKKKGKKTSPPVPARSSNENYQSVDVRQAKNGFVISTYNGRKSETYVAKDRAEMQTISKKLLGIK